MAMGLMSQLLGNDNLNQKKAGQIQRDMRKAQVVITLWAAPKPLLAFSRLTSYLYANSGNESQIDAGRMVDLIGNFIAALREDLGHVDSGDDESVGVRDLLSIFIEKSVLINQGM